MRFLLILFLVLASVAITRAEEVKETADIAFSDGKVWLDAKVIMREKTYLIVSYGGGIHTVHATDLMPGRASLLKIRPPTEEELAVQAATEKRQREAAVARGGSGGQGGSRGP